MATIRVGDADLDLYEVSITDGVVDQRDLGLYEERWERAKNWVAVVRPNRARAGGLDREFLPRAVGSRYHARSVEEGAFIEVGADYTTTTQKKIPARRYFRVILVRAKTWVIRDAERPEDSLTVPPHGPEADAARRSLARVQEPEPLPYVPTETPTTSTS